MNFYIDYGYPWAVCIDEADPVLVERGDLLDFLKEHATGEPITLICETGVRSFGAFIKELLDDDSRNEVIRIKGIDVKAVAKDLGIYKVKGISREQDDMNSALAIREAFKRGCETSPLTSEDFEIIKEYLMVTENRIATNILARLKVMKKAYARSIDTVPEFLDDWLATAEEYKKEKVAKIREHFGDQVQEVAFIKGLGSTYLSEVIAYANPSRFPRLKAFLAFCGFRATARYKDPTKRNVKGNVRRRYNIPAHTALIQAAENTIRQRDPSYRPVYNYLKADLAEREVRAPHTTAINRLATFLAKDVYTIHKHERPVFRGEEDMFLYGVWVTEDGLDPAWLAKRKRRPKPEPIVMSRREFNTTMVVPSVLRTFVSRGKIIRYGGDPNHM